MKILLLAASLASSPRAETEIVEGAPPRLGAGARLSWIQPPMADARLWIDGHVVVRPIPRILLSVAWGRSEENRRGLGQDTTLSEMRWDLGAGAVVLPGSGADIYIPALWRHNSQKHSRLGEASWSELATGLGVLAPIKGNFSFRSELLWASPTSPHPDLLLGAGRETDGSHLELSLGFVAFLN